MRRSIDKPRNDARKAARATVAQQHGGNASVKDRLDAVETALGMVPGAK